MNIQTFLAGIQFDQWCQIVVLFTVAVAVGLVKRRQNKESDVER